MDSATRVTIGNTLSKSLESSPLISHPN